MTKICKNKIELTKMGKMENGKMGKNGKTTFI